MRRTAEARALLAPVVAGGIVWATAGYGVGLAAQGIAPRWYQAIGFAAAMFFWTAWRRTREKLHWLCHAEMEMAEAAEYKGRLSAMPGREQSDALRAMVMDPELDDTMRNALQPLADYLEHIEKVRSGAE